MPKNTPAPTIPTMIEMQAAAREHLAAASEFARLWAIGTSRTTWRDGAEEAAFQAASTKSDESGRRLADMLEAAGVPAIIVNNQIVGSLLLALRRPDRRRDRDQRGRADLRRAALRPRLATRRRPRVPLGVGPFKGGYALYAYPPALAGLTAPVGCWRREITTWHGLASFGTARRGSARHGHP